jgi:hypothetical protein
MKQNHYNVEFKKKVIAFAEETLNLAAQQHYRIDKTNNRRWKKQMEEMYTA